ncbi:MAG TPA: hypothetical protein HA262_14535 [Methanosarcina sp.]|nr:hypothetical protein [Methanosarcina sp.]
MKKSSNMDALHKIYPVNRFSRKKEVKKEKRGENELKMISSGGMFR